MLSPFFLKVSLIGATSVLYLLIALSVLSVGIILERLWFYHNVAKGLAAFRQTVRLAAASGRWEDIRKYAEERMGKSSGGCPRDMETGVVSSLAASRVSMTTSTAPKALEELASDGMIRGKLAWEEHLVILATIGSNAPFIGLFGTVLGIIKSFHSLSEQAGSGITTVTAGISEALVATALGILVAIPAVVAYNLFQRRIKSALSEAEALKSYLLGRILS